MLSSHLRENSWVLTCYEKCVCHWRQVFRSDDWAEKKIVVVGEGLDTQRQAYLSRPNFHHATNAINHFWALLKWGEVA